MKSSFGQKPHKNILQTCNEQKQQSFFDEYFNAP